MALHAFVLALDIFARFFFSSQRGASAGPPVSSGQQQRPWSARSQSMEQFASQRVPEVGCDDDGWLECSLFCVCVCVCVCALRLEGTGVGAF